MISNSLNTTFVKHIVILEAFHSLLFVSKDSSVLVQRHIVVMVRFHWNTNSSSLKFVFRGHISHRRL